MARSWLVLGSIGALLALSCNDELDASKTQSTAGATGGASGSASTNHGGAGASGSPGGSAGAAGVAGAAPTFCSGMSALPYDPEAGAINIWPDDFWTVDDATSATGKRVHIVPGDNLVLPAFAAPFTSVFSDLSSLDGFGTTSGMLVQFATTIDPASLPVSGDGSSASTSSVLLIDLDSDPPVLLSTETAVMPESKTDSTSTMVVTSSLPLRPKAHYGLAVTNRVHDMSGSCVSPSPTMASLLGGTTTDPKLLPLVPRYADLIKKLVKLGAITSASELTAASVFTTQHTVDDSATIAKNIRAGTIPYQSLGACTIDASKTYRVCEGTMASFDYRATHLYIDETDLTKHDPWLIPVTTYLPLEPSDGPLPTFIFGHGLGGDRHQAADLAVFTAPKNIAVVAIDAVKHGNHPDQPPNPGDKISTITDFFGFSLSGAQSIDTRKLRDNFRESTYDKLQLVEMLRPGLDIDGDGKNDVDLKQLTYLGVSLGGIMSAEFLAFAPDTQVAIPIVPGARVTDIIQYASTFAPVILLLKGSASEGDVTRTFPLVQTAIDRGDAGAYTQHIVTDRLPGFDAIVPQTLMQMVIDDDTVPNVCNRFFARGLGVPLVGDELQHVGTIAHQQSLPTTANLDAKHTGGLFQYDVVWNTATPCCDLTTGKTMMATHGNVAANPITIDQTLTFVETYLKGALPTIIDPYRDLKVKQLAYRATSMLPDQVNEAFSSLSKALESRPELRESIHHRWRSNGRFPATDLPKDVRAATDLLGSSLPALTQSPDTLAALGELFSTPNGGILLAWCAANTSRRDAQMAGLFAIAIQWGFDEQVIALARERVVEGPLLDALSCAPLLGNGDDLTLPINLQARARLRILIWEAGASAIEMPTLGKWLWGSASTFEEMIQKPAHGTLRGRVLAARCLEIGGGGLPPDTDPELIGKTLQVLQPLLFHPEPLVWVHAARALGRLTGPVEQLQSSLLDWVLGNSQVLRQRAMTAFASLPAERLQLVAGQLVAILNSRDEEAWVLAAVAAATPYLFFERRDLWDRLAKRVLAGDGGAIAARALARGLGTLYRRGTRQPDVEAPLRALREMARAAEPTSIDDSRRWIEVTAATDPVDGAERDPLDLELGLENLVRVAAQYDDEEADARAARFASSLATTFAESRKLALGAGRLRQRAAAINALEGSARAFALRLWSPLLATRPLGNPIEEPDLEETWKAIAKAPEEILDLVKERRQVEGSDFDADLPLEVLAIRLGGYALDACGEDGSLGPGRGPTAHDTCLWLRKIAGVVDSSRELPHAISGALSTLFWRLVDTTRGTALGEVDDVEWLGPFAAWWALVIDRPTVLLQLATALPMMAAGALEKCCAQAEALRTAVSSGDADGAWGASATEALEALHAADTELAHALSNLARALGGFAEAKGPSSDLDIVCLDLVLSGDRLQSALADPVKALHAVGEEPPADSQAQLATENARRVAALVARAIRAREPSMLDVWFASLGPVASALLEAAVKGAMRRTPPPPPYKKKIEPKLIEGYELVKPLGEGGIGSVWLVRKPGADRLFVLKIPKADALANATEVERAGILDSFVEEAKALAGLYHPNVANIIDRGVSSGAPFLVLEYLIGADLKQYAEAHRMSFYELRQVVLESCAGLSALHAAGLVHRDIKPANLWLRLPLAGGERFDGAKHRNPAIVPPLNSVVIDFGMVRSIRVPADSAGRFVAGTPGYIAPEQVLDPVELDPRADVYSLAATIYNVTTGRSFFDDVDNPRDRILAHMRRDPLEDGTRLHGFPTAVIKVLRAATMKAATDRPSPMEFGREFAAAL